MAFNGASKPKTGVQRPHPPSVSQRRACPHLWLDAQSSSSPLLRLLPPGSALAGTEMTDSVFFPDEAVKAVWGGEPFDNHLTSPHLHATRNTPRTASTSFPLHAASRCQFRGRRWLFLRFELCLPGLLMHPLYSVVHTYIHKFRHCQCSNPIVRRGHWNSHHMNDRTSPARCPRLFVQEPVAKKHQQRG